MKIHKYRLNEVRQQLAPPGRGLPSSSWAGAAGAPGLARGAEGPIFVPSRAQTAEWLGKQSLQ